MLHLLALAVLTPRFHIAEDHGRQWLADASGSKFLSFGVCCVDTGTPFLSYDPGNPSYAAWKSYSDPHAWGDDTMSRLKSWGFNTVGAWSDTDDLHKIEGKDIYFTPILHMGSGAGAPWRDMWDPSIVKLMDQIAHDQVVPLNGESRIIGYFSDNEMGWWEGALFDWAWKSAGGRSHLMNILRARYPSWAALKKDFEPVDAGSLQDLSKRGRLYLQPGGNGMAAVQAYIKVLADRYYSLCSSIIKRYDPGALYLGDRYISNFYPEVAASSAPYVDVVSTNLNADANDGSLTPFYLPTLEGLTHKPILISEYYMAATENRSGNKNNSSGFPVAPTQRERAIDFAAQTRSFFDHPYVVGAHWFQYSDEAKNGRGDGENYNMGLVDTGNRPYEELTKASRDLDLAGDRYRPSSTPVPSFAPEVKVLSKTGRLKVIPGGKCQRGDAFFGRFFDDRIILGVYWNEDRFGEAFYRNGKVPLADRARIRFDVGDKSVQVICGEGVSPVIVGDADLVLNSTGVRNTLIISVPDPHHSPIKIHLDTRGRAYSGDWAINP